MPARAKTIDKFGGIPEESYKFGFVTDIEMDSAPKGLNEDIVRFISAKKDDRTAKYRCHIKPRVEISF